VIVDPAAAAFLESRLAETPRRRVRLCAHRGPGAPLQEMFILLAEDTYIRPHRHTGKVESLHVIAGQADAVFFDEAGAVAAVVPLGAPGSGRAFYYRVDTPRFHTLVLRSERFFFHEATTGPFRPEETAFAPWAPGEEDPAGAARYRAELERQVRTFTGAQRDAT
jgi:cupin fold WbuC family metalloprotein